MKILMDKFLKTLEGSLPDVQHVKLRTEPDCYGMSRIVSKGLGLFFNPYSFANWYHGWLSWNVKHVETFGLISPYKYLVATRYQESFLKDQGIDAIAVGAPFVYAGEIDTVTILRQKNSLLVMPPHVTTDAKKGWDEESYVKQILDLEGEFDYIVACVSSSCVQKKHWISQFKKYGIPYIVGADMSDKNALIRMSNIFKNFEYVTTNRIGSHVAYAAYSGCKVSIFGDYLPLLKEEFENDELYNQYPFLINNVMNEASKESVYSKFPFLFVHPKKASKNVQWAVEQLGGNNKKSFFVLAKHLGWLPHQQAYFWSRRVLLKLKKEISLFLC